MIEMTERMNVRAHIYELVHLYAGKQLFLGGDMNKGFNYDLSHSSALGFHEAEVSHSCPDIFTPVTH
ncbi:MAG: hypothetical protein ACMUIA_04805 [bacterium]